MESGQDSNEKDGNGSMNDSFGDRMKLFEGMESERRFMPTLPVMARIDGRCFTSFTREMDRPFDQRMTDLMVSTTKFLVDETGARMGYTQSDEISLCWLSNHIKSQIFFDGRIQKMVSQLAALATAWFNDQFNFHFDGYSYDTIPTFDARCWTVPNVEEGANVFLWRELDATRNSIESAARAKFSHNQCFKKNCSELQDMLFSLGVNWNDYPACFKRGTYVQRRKVIRKYTTEELDKLPELHDARKNPDFEVERSELVVLDMPPFMKVTNRPGVIFYGQEPRLEKVVYEENHQSVCS